jgi:hypothetical protein
MSAIERISRWWDGGDGPRDLVWRVRHRPWFSYPLRAARIGIEFKPFGFWWKPEFTHRRALSEAARQEGETIWWARWAWFQISYGRWI